MLGGWLNSFRTGSVLPVFLDMVHGLVADSIVYHLSLIHIFGSQNGVKVGKVEDGECYRVIHRPCKVVAGDVLYIANTKLLLT